MARGNHTGKGGLGAHPENINKGNVPKDTRVRMNKFKAWVFEVWEKNMENFEDLVISDQKVATDFLKLAASLCPKDVELSNKDGEPIKVKWEQ